jgi:hypothetical protein
MLTTALQNSSCDEQNVGEKSRPGALGPHLEPASSSNRVQPARPLEKRRCGSVFVTDGRPAQVFQRHALRDRFAPNHDRHQ